MVKEIFDTVRIVPDDKPQAGALTASQVKIDRTSDWAYPLVVTEDGNKYRPVDKDGFCIQRQTLDHEMGVGYTPSTP